VELKKNIEEKSNFKAQEIDSFPYFTAFWFLIVTYPAAERE